jgi:hypothetical protein
VNRLVTAFLFVGAIGACQRICGDMRPLSDAGISGGGDGGAGGGAGERGSTAGVGGVIEDGGAGGDVPIGGSAGSETGGTAGETCQVLTDPHIIDFDEDATSPAPALGTMISEPDGPGGGIETDTITTSTRRKVYHELGEVKAEQLTGFNFAFMPCVGDASLYVGIQFDVRANQSSLGLDVSMMTDSGTRAPVPFTVTDSWTTRCIPFSEVGDPQAIRQLLFRYTPSATPYSVDVYLDNLAFYQGACPTN